MPRPAFNYLARLSQFGGSAQRKRTKLWCRVLEETDGSLLPERFGCDIIPPRVKDAFSFPPGVRPVHLGGSSHGHSSVKELNES